MAGNVNDDDSQHKMDCDNDLKSDSDYNPGSSDNESSDSYEDDDLDDDLSDENNTDANVQHTSTDPVLDIDKGVVQEPKPGPSSEISASVSTHFESSIQKVVDFMKPNINHQLAKRTSTSGPKTAKSSIAKKRKRVPDKTETKVSKKQSKTEVSSSNESQKFEKVDNMEINEGEIFRQMQEKYLKSPLLDGKFFKFTKYVRTCVDGKITETIYGRCMICLTIVSTPQSSRTNLTRHLKRKHAANVFEEYEQYVKDKKNNKPSKSQPQPLEIPNPSNSNSIELDKKILKKTSQLTLPSLILGSGEMSEHQKKQFQKMAQEIFNWRLIIFVINGLYPISIVKESHFKNLFKVNTCPHEKNPMVLSVYSRTTLVNKIDEVREYCTAILIKEFSKTPHVCLAADIWSTQTRSFLGVTVFWLNDKFERQSAILSCGRLEGEHNYENISKAITSILTKFNLNVRNGQVIGIVTDNASNFVKSFKEFGLQNVYAVLRESDTDTETETENEIEDFEEIRFNSNPTSDYSIVDEDGNDLSDGDFVPILINDKPQRDEFDVDSSDTDNDFYNDEPSSPPLPPHYRCAAHTMNLLASTDFLKCIEKNKKVADIHKSVIQKCSAIWKASRRPGRAEKIAKVLDHRVIYPTVTRWNSLFDSLQFIHNNMSKMEAVTNVLNTEMFNDNEKNYINDFLLVMSPIALSLDRLQADYTHYGYFIPILYSLNVSLENLQTNNKHSKIVKFLASEILIHLNNRFEKFFKLDACSEVDSAILATVATPRFKLSCFAEHQHDLIKKMFTKAVLEMDDETIRDNVEKHTNSGDKSEIKNKVETDDFLQLCVKIKSTAASSSCSEVESFLNDGVRANQDGIYFQQFPRIKKVFLKFCTILCSSASVERLFSIGPLILTPKRKKLTDAHFENLITLRGNRHHLKNVTSWE